MKVQDSSDCCINSKFSSAQKGYFRDDYLSLFINKLHPRSPIINRGYYIRFRAIDEVFRSWWSSVNPRTYKYQVISLGSGYDTSYWRLKSSSTLPPGCLYVEIDFPEVMKRKYELIKDICHSSEHIPLEPIPAVVMYTGEYLMLGADLTDIPALEKCFASVGISYDVPTLLLSECSITYIDPKHSEAFICWVQSHFHNSVFVAYEQVYPNDAFGLIMRNHFTEVGCTLKSITKFPDEKSQRERFIELGWSECSAITMYDLFASLSSEEKLRVRQLEMFDEYEMWHEKCHHYVVVWAAQGLLSRCLPSLLAIESAITETAKHPARVSTMNWECVNADGLLERFGHQVTLVSSTAAIVSGGFGRIGKKHQRLGDIVLYCTDSRECLRLSPKDKSQLPMGKRMFHTMTKLSSDAIVIMGGRSSPKEIHKEVFVLRCPSQTKEESSALFEMISSEFLMPVPVWRHSASLMLIQGTEHILVFGGCSHKSVATDSCFILNTETWKYTTVGLQKYSPRSRHSHSAATYNGSCVIITGGLTEDEEILHSVHAFNSSGSLEWSTLDVSGLLPRYSHTSHVWNDHLLLVGGITHVASYKLGVGVVNLKTLQTFEVGLPGQDPEFPILLSNHSSYLHGDEISIVGGGGNCFSFGTHFNRKVVTFGIQELIM